MEYHCAKWFKWTKSAYYVLLPALLAAMIIGFAEVVPVYAAKAGEITSVPVTDDGLRRVILIQVLILVGGVGLLILGDWLITKHKNKK